MVATVHVLALTAGSLTRLQQSSVTVQQKETPLPIGAIPRYVTGNVGYHKTYGDVESAIDSVMMTLENLKGTYKDQFSRSTELEVERSKREIADKRVVELEASNASMQETINKLTLEVQANENAINEKISNMEATMKAVIADRDKYKQLVQQIAALSGLTPSKPEEEKIVGEQGNVLRKIPGYREGETAA